MQPLVAAVEDGKIDTTPTTANNPKEGGDTGTTAKTANNTEGGR